MPWQATSIMLNVCSGGTKVIIAVAKSLISYVCLEMIQLLHNIFNQLLHNSTTDGCFRKVKSWTH